MSGVRAETACGLSAPRASCRFVGTWKSRSYPHAAATAAQRAEDPAAMARGQAEMTLGLEGGRTCLVSHHAMARASNHQRCCRVFSDRTFQAALNRLSVTAES
jgi:hypothetical protein